MENKEIVKPYLTNTDIGIVLSEQQGIEIAEKARQDERAKAIKAVNNWFLKAGIDCIENPDGDEFLVKDLIEKMS